MVNVATPLTKFCWLSDALTPAGIPLTCKETGPDPKELTRRVATAVPEVIVKVRLFTFTLKSETVGGGGVQVVTADEAGTCQVES